MLSRARTPLREGQIMPPNPSRGGRAPSSNGRGKSFGKSPGKFFAKVSGNSVLKPEEAILFQTFFKSVGPRTYASQVKRPANGNHFLVLTEGNRDPDCD